MNPRKYQLSIINTAYSKNTLVVLPTGLGKTLIAFLLSRLYLSKNSNKKILFLAPTRPLVLQHQDNCNQILPEFKSTAFTGQISPEKRSVLFKENNILFSTPQGLENDIISNKINLKDVSLMIFDEAHRAVKNYSYTFISKKFKTDNPNGRILALTASPGSDIDTIMEVCANLGIKELEYRTIYDADVKEYVQESVVTELNCDFPDELKQIQSLLNACLKSKISAIKKLGFSDIDLNQISRIKLLKLQAGLSKEMLNGVKDFDLLKSVSLSAQALKVAHGCELLETQELTSLLSYFHQLDSDSKKTKVKATINLVKDPNWIKAKELAKELNEKQFEHPKIKKLKDLLNIKFEKKSNFKCIIFNQFRDTAVAVYNVVNKINGAKPILFFGQAKKKGKGHSQKEQKQIIEDFKDSKYNILIATSVAEEGLDIPQVNSVIFFEPIPSAIRSIQRRGRTGRHDEGSIYVLINKGTRDESYKWSSFHKEKRMYRVLKDLKQKLTIKKLDKKELESNKLNQLVDQISDMDRIKERIKQKISAVETKQNVKSIEVKIDIASVKKEIENDPLLEDLLFEKVQDEEIKNTAPSKTILNQLTQTSLLTYSDSYNETGNKKYKIIVDYREKNSLLISELMEEENSIHVELKSLTAGDYLLSKKVAVEYKKENDFVNSILDGRLFSQAKELAYNYLKPIIVVESKSNLLEQTVIGSSALFGALMSLIIDFNISVVFTRDEKETARLFKTIIKREQEDDFKHYNPHASNKPKDVESQIEYVTSALPGLGLSLAKTLLSHFGNLKNIANASIEDLQKVEKIGPTKAKYIHQIFNHLFN